MRKLAGRGGLYALLGAFAFFGAFPFYWMVIATFKTDHDLFSPLNNPFLFNEPPTLDHLQNLLFETHFHTYLTNTLWVGLAVVVITLVVAVPAAYSLARWARGWGEMLGIGIFLTYLVPPDDPVHPPVPVHLLPGAPGVALVPDPRLPDLHDPVLHLAAHGVLQDDPRRTSRSRR